MTQATLGLFALYTALAQVQPALAALQPALAAITVPAGAALSSENAPCQGFPLVLDGEIKVSRSSGDGRSLELYRVVPGEMCLISAVCSGRSRCRPMTSLPGPAHCC